MSSHPAAVFVPSPAVWRESSSTTGVVLGWAALCWLAGELWLQSHVIPPLIADVALTWFGLGLGAASLALGCVGMATVLRRKPSLAAITWPMVPVLAFALVCLAGAHQLPLKARFSLSSSIWNTSPTGRRLAR